MIWIISIELRVEIDLDNRIKLISIDGIENR
jgi:hypothetical protein